jgi:hypothetical protein
MTYHVALAFKRSEDGGDIVACDPKEAGIPARENDAMAMRK